MSLVENKDQSYLRFHLGIAKAHHAVAGDQGLKLVDAEANAEISCKALFTYILQTPRLRLVSFDNVLYCEKNLLYTTQLSPVHTSTIFVGADGLDAGSKALVAQAVAFSRAKGVSTSSMFVASIKTPGKFVEAVKTIGDSRPAVAIVSGEFMSGMDHIMQLCLMTDGTWKGRNVAIKKLDPDDLDPVMYGKLVLPRQWVMNISAYGMPMYLWHHLRVIDSDAADSLMYHAFVNGGLNSGKSIDGSLDPIRVYDILGLGSVGMLCFAYYFGIPARSHDFVMPTFIKETSGCIPRNGHLTHLLTRDQLAYGVERLFCDKQPFFGDGMVELAIRFFSIVSAALKVDLPFESIHAGEVAAYIYYCWYSGDCQTLVQVVHQLARRKGKLASCLKLKSSGSRGNVRIVNFTEQGWDAKFSNTITIAEMRGRGQDKSERSSAPGNASKRSSSEGPPKRRNRSKTPNNGKKQEKGQAELKNLPPAQQVKQQQQGKKQHPKKEKKQQSTRRVLKDFTFGPDKP